MSARELHAEAAVLMAAQERLLALACQVRAAAWAAERDELDAAEGARLLREARTWLGAGVREVG